MTRKGKYITDDYGRINILRGVNLGGSSKIPFPGSGGSFVGRPFPLEEAEGHFDRLKFSGFNFVRLLVTWEALEHSGPGQYDEPYLSYLEKILLIAGQKGISVLLDPHQDVWSRWTGGDGAPLWTLEKLGIDTAKLDPVGAAVTPEGCKEAGRPYRTMVWPVNYSLYAAASMFTLFFAGNSFAPQVKIDGENAQDYLQGRYLAAFGHCLEKLKNCRALAGLGVMNEPHPGFIGYGDLRGLENVTLALGPMPSPFQAMIAASGYSVRVKAYAPWLKGWLTTGREIINPDGQKLFLAGYSCPWKQAGVWTDEKNSPRLLRPDHFSKYQGRSIRFTDDFLKPFMLSFMEKMQKVKKPSLFFIEGIPHGENPHWGKEDPQNVVNAFHHYDGFTLFTKSFRPWFTVDTKTGRLILGKKRTAAHYSAKLAEAKSWARENMEEAPCFLGEFGLPFDLNHGKAHKTGDYSLHERALSLYYDAIDENLLGSAIWNYTADNDNINGDHWNGEDLSIVSGGKPRAEGGWRRPYPAATAGIPLKFNWDRRRLALYYRFNPDPGINAPTEIYLPAITFGKEPSVTAIGLNQEPLRTKYSTEEEKLYVYNDGYSGEVLVTVSGGHPGV